MIRRYSKSQSRLRVEQGDSAVTSAKLLSLFAVPKPQQGHTAVIQANAIRSWARLIPDIEVFLCLQDHDPRLIQLAGETDCQLIQLTQRIESPPVLQEAFAHFHQRASGDVLAYSNADIMFDTRLMNVAQQLRDSELDSFVAIGQRTELSVNSEVDFGNLAAVNALFARADLRGKRASVVCKDFFLFSRDMYREVPAFLVGRGNWDNWMVHHAHKSGIPVVDVSDRLSVIHQSHRHDHVSGGRLSAYVNGPEARHNQRLAGGRHLLRGSLTNWVLGETGPVRRKMPWTNLITDAPRFLRLLRDLLFLGYFLGHLSLHL